MCSHQSPDSIASFKNLLPQWGEAADEIYQNFHFLNFAEAQSERLLIPEETFRDLLRLKELLINTIADLIQDLPSTSHRLSNKKSETLSRFNQHTDTLKTVNEQTSAFVEHLLHTYPSLKNWFES
ncbi:hypothetical protein ACFQ4C_03465 [Larkinella insperata]|uniref:Uncharacterized protein n=1 Tax=Larkinella insperata TaxID=332158 RepID=A0ABW3Q7L4_9BACT|nr:hypothetical protein [Larkinella insperata]